jgi:hypothetical protein
MTLRFHLVNDKEALLATERLLLETPGDTNVYYAMYLGGKK